MCVAQGHHIGTEIKEFTKLIGSCFLGSKNGLSLILNVEQYEYMKGPQTDAGVKVSE